MTGGVGHVEGAIMRGSDVVAPLMRALRSKHIRRASFACDFLFRPRPALHTTVRARTVTCSPSEQSTKLDRAPPRGVTVFAERSDETGAPQPQQRRRHFPPSHRLWVRSSLPHVPRPCAVTSLAAGVRVVHARLSRAGAAPAPRASARYRICGNASACYAYGRPSACDL